MISSHRLSALALSLAWVMSAQGQPLADNASAVDTGEIDYPVVITPTRLKQSLAEVPASVTIITADMLKRYGIKHIAEALALVPGMEMFRSDGNRPPFKVNYHGTNSTNPRRLNVLIDGVSTYSAGVAGAEWNVLPVALEDIDRIEVTRGPDSSSYGPNSMMAVVNIQTKHPRDVESFYASTMGTTRGETGLTARLGTQLGRTSLRATYQQTRDESYDASSLVYGARNTQEQRLISLRANTDLSGGTGLDASLTVLDAQRQIGQIDLSQISFPDTKDRRALLATRLTMPLTPQHQVQASFNVAKTEFRQPWRSCWPKAFFLPEVIDLAITGWAVNRAGDLVQGRINLFSPTPSTDPAILRAQMAVAALGLDGLTLICGRGNNDNDELRIQAEVQDTYVHSSALRLVAGAGMRHQSVYSSVVLAGSQSNNVMWVFGHGEIRPTDRVSINLGGYYEHNTLGSNTFSPRAAVNWQWSDRQTLRAVYSEGTRTPDVIQERANWTYRLDDLTPLYNGASSAALSGALVSLGGGLTERIRSFELGYLQQVPSLGLTVDVKAFDDHLSDLIVDYVSAMRYAKGASTNSSVQLTGVEVQARWALAQGWSGFLNYCNLLNRHATQAIEQAQYARHSGSVGISRDFGEGWQAALAYYGASSDGQLSNPYSRTDLNISKDFKLRDSRVNAGFTLSYLDTLKVNDYAGLPGSFSFSYRQHMAVGARVSVSF